MKDLKNYFYQNVNPEWSKQKFEQPIIIFIGIVFLNNIWQPFLEGDIKVPIFTEKKKKKIKIISFF